MITLTDLSDVDGAPLSCSGSGGYGDFDEGMSVTVHGGDGEIVAATRTRHADSLSELYERMLLHGETTDADGAPDLVDTLSGYWCPLLWEAEVPSSGFYTVEVGGRGKITYSLDEVVAADWAVLATLGIDN